MYIHQQCNQQCVAFEKKFFLLKYFRNDKIDIFHFKSCQAKMLVIYLNHSFYTHRNFLKRIFATTGEKKEEKERHIKTTTITTRN